VEQTQGCLARFISKWEDNLTLRRYRPSLSRIADRGTIATAALICLAAGILPLVVAAVLSFSSLDSRGAFHLGSLEGYHALVRGGRLAELRKLLIRSGIVSLMTMLIAVPAAYWIARLKRKGLQTNILAILLATWLVSDMLRAFGWQLLLSPNGFLSASLNFILRLDYYPSLRYGFFAMILGLVSSMLPAGILTVLAAVPDLNRSEWLAASEIGRPRNIFSLMALGRARPGIVLGLCVVFILSCFASAEARFLDGPTQTSIQTIASSLADDGVPSLLALGTSSVVFAFVCCFATARVYSVSDHAISWRRDRKGDIDVHAPLEVKSADWMTLRRLTGALLDAAALYAPPFAGVLSLLLCCCPLLAVSVEAFRQPSRTGMRWTLENFRLMLSSDQLLEAIRNSAAEAIIVAIVTASIAFLLSLVIWDSAWRKWILVLLIALAVLPGDVYAISLFQVLKTFGRAEGGLYLVVLAHVIWAVPLATGSLILANRQLAVHSLEAALEYGNTPIAVIFRFVGRINLSKIVGVALLAATLSLNEYVRASYLGASLVTISNEVHGRLTAGLLPQNRGVFAAEFLLLILSPTVALSLAFVRFARLSTGANRRAQS
jgi:ABC-type spermidine/putrescine transport system permease subunit II